MRAQHVCQFPGSTFPSSHPVTPHPAFPLVQVLTMNDLRTQNINESFLDAEPLLAVSAWSQCTSCGCSTVRPICGTDRLS